MESMNSEKGTRFAMAHRVRKKAYRHFSPPASSLASVTTVSPSSRGRREAICRPFPPNRVSGMAKPRSDMTLPWFVKK